MISKDDMNFLIQLQEEMLTQPHDSQAAPRFWTVGDYKDISAPEDECDGIVIYSTHEGDTIADNMNALVEYLNSVYEDDLDISGIKILADEKYTKPENNQYAYKIVRLPDDGSDNPVTVETDNITDMWELIEELDSIGILDENEYSHFGYRRVHCVCPDTFFITKKECQEHIEANHYHYNQPHTYAMTAWRAPKVKKLYEILEQTDWKEVMEKLYGTESE